jgi:hypothetical protein
VKLRTPLRKEASMLRFIFRVPHVIARAGAILWNRY